MSVRVAWALTIFSVLCGIGDTWITAASRPLTSEETVARHGWPFVTLATIGATAMGALIVSRGPRHLVGWLLCVVGVTSSISLVAEAYALWVTNDGGPGPQVLANLSAWVSSIFGGSMSLTGLILVFLLVPDGRWLTPGWRFVGWVACAGLLSVWVGLALLNPTTYQITEPDGTAPVTLVLVSIGFILIACCMLAAAVCLVVRLRRSRGRQRQQLRVITWAAGLVAAGLVILFFGQLANGGEQTWLAGLPLFISYFLLPILFAFAVLRYRLYEIEVIINRATLLAVGTAFAAVGYIALVVTASRLIDSRTGGFWLSLLASTVVALAFQPVRQAAVRFANRLAFGTRAAPYEALADFSRRLAHTPSIDTLLPAVAEAAGTAVSARRVTVALWVSGDTVASAVWPTDAPHLPTDHRVPIEAAGETLGVIDLSLPRGRAWREDDGQLLRDLADHAALAFRNAGLQVQLTEQVAALAHSTDELRASRRRMIEAEDVERRRLEAAIARDVLPPLVALPEQIATVRAAERDQPGTASAAIGPLVDATNQALEALRDLTRGVFPTQLSRVGLVPTLRSFAARQQPSFELVVAPPLVDRRFPPRVESAVYVCCVELLGRATSHPSVELELAGEALVLRVRGSGLAVPQDVMDRVESVGASWSLSDADDEVIVRFPVPAPASEAPLDGATEPSRV